jgi:tetratricopeptide (TPR) repeat protein
MLRYLLLPLLLVPACAAQESFSIAGRFTPAGRAAVTMFGSTRPFSASTTADDEGRFSFSKIRPGTYTVAIFLPALGEARQTIEVGPGTADSKGRVPLQLHLRESDFAFAATGRRHAIDARQLSVPEKAVREYEAAQKDLSRNDAQAAERHLERAVELAPQYSTAWNNLGTMAYQTRRFPRAEQCFREALKQDPDAYEPLVNLGGVLINLGKLDEAWNYNVHAVLARPNDPLANSQLGMTYFTLGRPELAEKYLLIARNLDPAHFSHPQLTMAEILLRRGERRSAAGQLEDFLVYHPDWHNAEKIRSAIAELRK